MDTTQRCVVCKKKLGLLRFSCKCSNSEVFCIHHKYPETHECLFDFKKEHKEVIEKNNPSIENLKVVHI